MLSPNILAVGSCVGKAPEEYNVEKTRVVFPFCALKSKLVPRVPSVETGVVSEGQFHLDMLSHAEC